MPDVYISYSQKNTGSAKYILKALENQGISCWMTGRDVADGEDPANVIPDVIRQSKFFVILISKSSLSSNYVKKELLLAVKENLTLLPVRLDNTRLHGAFEYHLGTKQWINAGLRLSAASQKLINLIHGDIISPTAPHNITPEMEAENIQKENKQFIIRSLIFALICIAFLIATSVAYAIVMREGNNIELYWKIDALLGLPVILSLFFIFAPLYGGYKTFLRTLLVKLLNAFRGK